MMPQDGRNSPPKFVASSYDPATPFNTADTASLLRDPETGGYPMGNRAESMDGPPSDTDQAGSSSFCSCLTVRYYQPYFDVDTDNVKDRILYAVFPFKRPTTFLELLGSNPDAYGPFWVATTLFFIISVVANFSSWYKFTGKSWMYDFQLVVTCAAVVYCWAGGVPVIIYFTLRYIQLPMSFIQALSIYGYSLFPFVPLTLLNIIPSGLVAWLTSMLGAAFSIVFLMKVLGPNIIEKYPAKSVPLLGTICTVQLALALTIKLAFFHA